MHLPPSEPALPSQDVGIEKARPLDLFFDLVFVFAVSQVAGLVAHPHSGLDYLQALLAGFGMASMYNAFVWFTGNTNFEDEQEAWLIFTAMVCFFVMALSVPTTHGAGAIPFSLALFTANLIHFYLFSRVRNSSAQAIYQIAPYNLTSTILIIFAAFAPGNWHWGLWIAAFLIYIVALARRSSNRYQFSLSPLHFIERHGLLIIIALGESVMGLGLGARDLPMTLTLLTYAGLGLLLAGTLWWSYFGPDNQRAEHRMLAAAPNERVFLAGNMGLTHFLMVFGIILVAAGLEVGVHHPLIAAPAATAWNLAIGICLYFVGDVLFRRFMGIGPGRLRGALALAALCTVPLGTHFSAMWQLVACVVLVGGVTIIEDYVLEPKREAGH